MAPYQILPKVEIQRWLRALIHEGEERKGSREGATLKSIAAYTGIPNNTLIWLARKESSDLNRDRQRLLSKVIAQIENGLLDFERKGAGKAHNRKVAIIRDNPKVLQRYGVSFARGVARLTYIDRPRLFAPMPKFRDLLID